MKQKFSESLTKRHRSTAEYVYVVTQSAAELEDADLGFRTLSGDFEEVTRALNEIDDVIDMDRNVSECLVRTIYIDATIKHKKRTSFEI
jgi:hypothetical protein